MNNHTSQHGMQSGYGQEPPKHANDVYTNWNQNGQDNISKGAKEKPVHTIWNRLQILDDEIQRMYSTRHDFIEAPTSAYTEAFFKMLPFESTMISLQILSLVVIQIFITIALLYFEVTLNIILVEQVAAFLLFFMYPFSVIVRSKQWVSGGAYTTRFYGHIKNIANFTLIMELFITFLLYYMKFYISVPQLEKFMVKYAPEIITQNDLFSIDKIIFIFQNIYIVPAFIFVLTIVYYSIALVRVKKLQKRNSVLIHKEINSNANVAESIMNDIGH